MRIFKIGFFLNLLATIAPCKAANQYFYLFYHPKIGEIYVINDVTEDAPKIEDYRVYIKEGLKSPYVEQSIESFAGIKDGGSVLLYFANGSKLQVPRRDVFDDRINTPRFTSFLNEEFRLVRMPGRQIDPSLLKPAAEAANPALPETGAAAYLVHHDGERTSDERIVHRFSDAELVELLTAKTGKDPSPPSSIKSIPGQTFDHVKIRAAFSDSRDNVILALKTTPALLNAIGQPAGETAYLWGNRQSGTLQPVIISQDSITRGGFWDRFRYRVTFSAATLEDPKRTVEVTEYRNKFELDCGSSGACLASMASAAKKQIKANLSNGALKVDSLKSKMVPVVIYQIEGSHLFIFIQRAHTIYADKESFGLDAASFSHNERRYEAYLGEPGSLIRLPVEYASGIEPWDAKRHGGPDHLQAIGFPGGLRVELSPPYSSQNGVLLFTHRGVGGGGEERTYFKLEKVPINPKTIQKLGIDPGTIWPETLNPCTAILTKHSPIPRPARASGQ